MEWPAAPRPGWQAFWLEHAYPAEGTYWVSVMVSDDDGGQASDQFLVSVIPRTYWLYLSVVRR